MIKNIIRFILIHFGLTVLFSVLCTPFVGNQTNILIAFLLPIPITACMYFIFKKENRKLFTWKKLSKQNIILFLSSIPILIGMMFILAFITSFFSMQQVKQETLQEINHLQIVLSIFIACVVAPICEEITYRGILRGLIPQTGVYIVVSSIWFGIAHIQIAPTLYQAIYPVIVTGCIGGYLAYLYTKTENIYTNIMIHSGYNLIIILLSKVI